MAKKPSLGRQRIKIARIEKASHRQVTFSKRRSGIFKKACELTTLCGVEIAVVVFSPAGRVYSFGHPNVDSLVAKFLSKTPNSAAASNAAGKATGDAGVVELLRQLDHLDGLLDLEKKKGDFEGCAREGKWWWESPMAELEVAQLEQLSVSLEELKSEVSSQVKKYDLAMATEPVIRAGSVEGFEQFFDIKPANYGYECGDLDELGFGA